MQKKKKESCKFIQLIFVKLFKMASLPDSDTYRVNQIHV